MVEATPVASDSEVVCFDSTIRAFFDLEVAQDVFLDGALDEVVDGGKDSFCPFRRKMDLIIHVVVSEVQVVERDEGGSDFVGASFELRSEEARLVPFLSVWCSTDGGIDDENGFARCIGVRFQNLDQLSRLCLGRLL